MKLSCTVIAFLCAMMHLTAASRPGVLVTAPKVFLAGTNENICVTLHNIDFDVNLAFKLSQNEGARIFSEERRTVSGGHGGCYGFMVPADVSSGRVDFTVAASSASEDVDYEFVDMVQVDIQKSSVVTFIQTDKPQYKPGQTVKFRILSTSPDLKPLTEPISEVWIENPSGTRMAQWRDVATEQGLVSLEMELADEPALGEWKISADISASGTSQQPFKVEEYSLPKYEIAITPPPFLLANAEVIIGEVCAKYTFGQPVRGNLNLKVCVNGSSSSYYYRPPSRRQERPCFQQQMPIVGCSEFSFPASAVELSTPRFHVWNAKLTIEAPVTEDGTGTVLNKTHEGPSVSYDPVTIDMSGAKNFYKPGLTYYGKGKVKNPDGSPSVGETVQYSVDNWRAGSSYRRNVTTNEKGEFFIELPLAEIENSVNSLSVRLSVPKYERIRGRDRRGQMRVPLAYHNVKPWFSPTGSYLQLGPLDGIHQCQGHLHVGFAYTTERISNVTLHYSVMSGGDIVSSGYIAKAYVSSQESGLHGGTDFQIEQRFPDDERCPGNQIWRECGSPCTPTCENQHPICAAVCQPRCTCPYHIPILHNGTCVAYAQCLPETAIPPPRPFVANAHIDIPLSAKFAGSSRVTVYYVQADGEIIADSASFTVQQCLENEVSLTFDQDEVRPGGQTYLNIQADPFSLCAIGVVDKSVHLLGGSNQLTQGEVFSKLAQYDVNENSGTNIPDDYCRRKMGGENPDDRFPPIPGPIPMDRKKRSVFYGPQYYSNHFDASTAFRSSGFVTLSDLRLETRPCLVERHRVMYALPDGAVPRRAQLSPVGRVGRPGPAEPSPVAEEDTKTPDEAPSPAVAVRTYFPETWLWDLHSVRGSGRLSVSHEAPHTITDWIGSGFCTNLQTGLGVSQPTSLRVFQPFFLSFTLPYSLIRGEDVVIPVTVFNYLNECLKMRVTLRASRDFELVTGIRRRERLICGQESVTLKYKLRPLTLGEINITVKALSVEGDEEMSNDITMSDQIGVRDMVTRQILVEPEGREDEYTYSAFVCPTAGNTVVERANLTLPTDLVPDSARAYINVIGDVMGPSLSGLDKLLRLPTGCGEQNMLKFAPNIFVMQYLTATNQVTGEIRAKSLEYLRTGYQRELNYKHHDHSYSAFGNSDASGSTWLTAFVVKSFAQAKPYIFIDDNDVTASVNWFKSKQQENGCFPQLGRVLHKDMKGGLAEGSESPATLTAYVLIAMLEAGIPKTDRAVQDAILCLDRQTVNDVYTLTLMAYAYSVWDVNSSQRSRAMERLDQLAIRDDDMVHWQKAEQATPTPSDSWCHYHQSPAADVEMTAYALLAHLKTPGSGAIAGGLPIVRWLSKQRNAYGGFSSTQDTVVALQALAQYASRVYGQGVDLQVEVHSETQIDRFSINGENSLLLQRQPIDVPNNVAFEVSGSGCALVQANVKYNLLGMTSGENDAFTVRPTVSRVPGDCAMRAVEICTTYNGDDGASNMAVVEVKMVSGWMPDKDSVKRLSGSTEHGIKRADVDMNYVHFYFDELTNEEKCWTLHVSQHVVVTDSKPAIIKAYDYYEKEKFSIVQYSIRHICGTKQELPLEPDLQPDNPFVQRREPIELPPGLFGNEEESVEEEVVEPEIVPDIVIPLDAREGAVREEVVEPEIVPVFVNPLTNVGMPSRCPQCHDSPPDNVLELACQATHVYKASLRSGNRVKVRTDLKIRSRRGSSINVNARVIIPSNCDCDILGDLDRNDNLLIFTGDAGLNESAKINLDDESVVIPLTQRASAIERSIKRAIKHNRC